MKHICFFNSLNFWGGGEKFYHEFALGLRQKGYKVSIVSHPNSLLTKKAIADQIPVHSAIIGNLSFLNPYKIWVIARYFRKAEIDTLFFSTSQDLKTAGLAAAFAGVKNIVYRRGLAVAKKNSFLNRFFFSKVVTKIIANSEETKNLFLQNLVGTIAPERVEIIYNGIALSEIDQIQIKPVEFIDNKKTGIVLGNAGRLTEQKGQNYLLEVAKILKDRGCEFTLFIAGTGELESSLNQKIQEAGLESQVFLIGFVEDMANFMRCLDIFVLSSLWEGFGYVLTEAMAQSKPIVAFDSSSNPEVVADGETGILVPTADVLAFANAVEKFIYNDALRSEMGKAGRKRVEQFFAFDIQLDRLEKYLIS